jgi:L-ascorbate metabolism protein UlaG (beta-lactamase superfamily)
MIRFLLPLLALALVGCGGGSRSVDSWPSRPKTVKVQWFGHQSFLITSSLGTRILTNPFAPGSVPHSFPRGIQPEVLLISQERRDSNFVQGIENFPTTFRSSVGMGSHTAFGIRFLGLPVFPEGSERDIGLMNLVFSWTFDGIRFCFAGDVPRALEPDEISRIGAVDVLFLPVGGRAGESVRRSLLAGLRPRMIIPMGRTGAVSAFLSEFPTTFSTGSPAVLLNAATLPATPTAIALGNP